MNWGRSIIVAFVLFAAFLFYIVYGSMTAHFDLVADDYYKQELEYQKVIDSKHNTNELKEKISLKVENKIIRLILPEELRANATTGQIHFYSAQNAERDQKLELSFDQNGQQDIQIEKFTPGNYIAKIKFSNSGRDYYTEIPVKI